MEIPFLLKTAAWAQMGPPLALLARRNRSRPVLWVAAGATVSVLGNWLGRIEAHRSGNNHWVAYIDGALMYTLYLIALTEWQVDRLERLALRVAIFLLLVVYLALVLWVEDLTTFPRFATPFYSVALLGAAVWTLLRRAFATFHRPIHRTDWFWIVGGLALYAVATVVAQPVSKILLENQRLDLFTLVYSFRAVCIDIAFAFIVWGFLIPPGPTEAAP